MVNKKEIEQLRQALLAAKDEQGAAMVANMHSEITVYPQRFLPKYRIYRVLYYSPYKPILLYLGFAPGLPLYSLAGNPEAFLHMAQADGVDLVSLDMAINYVSVFLEVTRNMYELVYQVNSVDQLRFIPRLSPAQLEAKEALVEKYRSALTSPTGEVTADGYTIVAHVTRQQELERHTLKVHRNGEMASEIAVIEQDMPLVFGI